MLLDHLFAENSRQISKQDYFRQASNVIANRCVDAVLRGFMQMVVMTRAPLVDLNNRFFTCASFCLARHIKDGHRQCTRGAEMIGQSNLDLRVLRAKQLDRLRNIIRHMRAGS